MAVEITFLGHAGFLIADGDTRVVIDPFLTGNPVAKHQPSDIRAQHVVLTHGHEDHFGDTLEIAKANDATVYAAYEICNFCGEEGHAKVEPGNPGGQIDTDFGYVAFTQALHSSSYKGRYMGPPCGVILSIAGKTIYHLGDTALFGDLKMIGELYRPDVSIVPVGDRFTMGPAHGKLAAEMVGAPLTIPMHYGTFPILTNDISGFAPEGIKVCSLEVGGTLEV